MKKLLIEFLLIMAGLYVFDLWEDSTDFLIRVLLGSIGIFLFRISARV